MSRVDPHLKSNLSGQQASAFAQQRLKDLREEYRTALFDDLVPWWIDHSLDADEGGYFTRLDREGRTYSHDKDIWMTGRQVWMFAHLYNAHERNALWLEVARLGAEFLLKHAFRPDGGMYFRLTRDGRPLSDVLSKYTLVFGAIGLAEYAHASGDEAAREKSLEIYDRLIPKLDQLSNTPMLGYPIQAQLNVHAQAMCKLTVTMTYHTLLGEECYKAESRDAAQAILQRHWKPSRRVLLENSGPDGEELFELPEGRTVIPGHAIESAWMMLEVGERDQNQALIDASAEVILASLELAWDTEYGGVRYILNVDGSPCHNIEADCKLWWPHGEALYGTLLAWKLTGRQEFVDWYEKVHSYTFSHFPDPQFGEWYGYLNRDGSPIWTAKANGWKGFFHLPRIMHRAYQLLSERDLDPAKS